MKLKRSPAGSLPSGATITSFGRKLFASKFASAHWRPKFEPWSMTSSVAPAAGSYFAGTRNSALCFPSIVHVSTSPRGAAGLGGPLALGARGGGREEDDRERSKDRHGPLHSCARHSRSAP